MKLFNNRQLTVCLKGQALCDLFFDVGLHKEEDSSDIEEIEECLLQDDTANKILNTVKGFLPGLQHEARPHQSLHVNAGNKGPCIACGITRAPRVG